MMKNILAASLLLLATATILSGQTVADSQRQALAKYPALAQEGSPLHAKFLALYNDAKQNNPKLLSDSNWPIILADRAAQPGIDPAKPAPDVVALGKVAGKEASLGLKIVKDELVENEFFYNVKGTVYNPNDKPVKNVVIKYYIWKKWLGKDGHGSRVKETGGLVVATIKFLPPKQSVAFTADSDNAPMYVRKAPIMLPKEMALLPDPLGEAEISAEWDQ